MEAGGKDQSSELLSRSPSLYAKIGQGLWAPACFPIGCFLHCFPYSHVLSGGAGGATHCAVQQPREQLAVVVCKGYLPTWAASTTQPHWAQGAGRQLWLPMCTGLGCSRISVPGCLLGISGRAHCPATSAAGRKLWCCLLALLGAFPVSVPL